MPCAWITGASGAWGKAFARTLLEDGYDVVALGRHDIPDLAERAAALGRSWTVHRFDLSARQAPSPRGVPDLLILAAVSIEGDREELASTDYLAPVALIDSVAHGMLQRGSGRIGVLVPQNARLGLAGSGDLSAAQAALWTWSEALRDELSKDAGDVTLTLVIPGRTASPTQRFVSERSGHSARLSAPDATRLVRAVSAGRRHAGRRPWLATLAMLFR